MLGISVKKTIGLGDAIQFSGVPENYYRATGKTLIDVTHHWVFDHNPYVHRNFPLPPEKIYEMWNYEPIPRPRDSVFLSLAEKHCEVFKVPVVMKYPRLYLHEKFPIEKRDTVLFHTHGVSHGAMPEHVIEHVLRKYRHMNLLHVGLESDPYLGIPKVVTPTIWDLVKVIAECRMFIGVDSGPSWIACCYPDVITKKLRTKPGIEALKSWVPLSVSNLHAQWDDRIFQVYNPSEDDVGFTSSYRRI